MKRRAFLRTLGTGCGAVLLPRLPNLRFDDQLVERWSWAMGQPVHLLLFASSEQEGLDGCAAALAELRRIEARLTLFDDASDVCELNRHAGRSAMRVDRDLRTVLELAHAFRRATAGGFDVTIEPLMRVWGFHGKRASEPTHQEIRAARDAVIAAEVRLDGNNVRLPGADTRIDLGGIGVGYGIDRALAVLRDRGIRRAFIDISGDCGALKAPPGDDGWLVEIVDPSRPGQFLSSLRLCDAALATSANTNSVVRYGQAVRGHVMNPVTGWPAHALRQVTVVSRSAAAADAMSTGMLVNHHRPAGALQVFEVKT